MNDVEVLDGHDVKGVENDIRSMQVRLRAMWFLKNAGLTPSGFL